MGFVARGDGVDDMDLSTLTDPAPSDGSDDGSDDGPTSSDPTERGS